MPTYRIETKVYEHQEFDEEAECYTGTIDSYHVFSTIKINEYTFVRAVVDTSDGSPAKPRAREWFVEWKATFGVANATQRMTGKMTRAQALRRGEEYAALIPAGGFADLAAVDAFYEQHRPTEPTYGH